MTRILISRGFGAGWSSWYSGSSAEIRFILTSPILIAACDRQDAHDEADNEYAYQSNRRSWASKNSFPDEWVVLAKNVLSGIDPDQYMTLDELLSMPYEVMAAIPEFVASWRNEFQDRKLPCLGGLDGITVVRVDDDLDLDKCWDFVIVDHDGHERVEWKNPNWC